MVTQDRLKELFNYDPNTGIFTNIKARSKVSVGSTAGSASKSHGYVQISFNNNKYLAHRMAWLYVHGELPANQIDHINRVRTDNRLCNLRLANNAENNQNRSMHRNNKSGHIGVFWVNSRTKWQAKIKVNYKDINLGQFTDLSEAIAARKAAEVKYHTFCHWAVL